MQMNNTTGNNSTSAQNFLHQQQQMQQQLYQQQLIQHAQATMPQTPRRIGRKKGVKNYRDNTLYDIVHKVLPSSKDEWDNVAQQYQTMLDDPCPHKGKNIKRHFLLKAFSKNDPTANSLQTLIAGKMKASSRDDQDFSRHDIKRQRTYSASNDEVDQVIQQQGEISPLSAGSYDKTIQDHNEITEIHPGILDQVNTYSNQP